MRSRDMLYADPSPDHDRSRYRNHVSTSPETRPAGAVVLSDRFEQALQFAAATHRTQFRKGSGIPYMGHLLGVCSLVIEDGGSEDEAIGALLHDAAEDHGGQAMLDQIKARFGDHVAAIVKGCTDTLESPKPPWCERKRAYIEHLKQPARVGASGIPRRQAVQRARDPARLPRRRRRALDPLQEPAANGQLWYYRQLADQFTTLLPNRYADVWPRS